MKEQPTEQTVREILIKYWGDVDLSTASDKAEAAINAHIVSVLEGLKEQVNALEHQNTVKLGTVIKWVQTIDTIDAAIAKHKQADKS